MVAEPVVTPVTMPVVLTVAIAVLVLLHVPPLTASASVVVKPTQAVVVPVIAAGAGSGLTVTMAVSVAVPQLLVTEYVIMALPAAMPVTVPVALTLAIAALLVVHVPPEVALLSVVVALWQTVCVPVIVPALGTGTTVTSAVSLAVPQLLVTEYVIMAVPSVSPVTTPVVLTLALAALLLLQVPPAAPSVKVVVDPIHTVWVPVMLPALGSGLTVMA